ncbi:SnoaL-like domain-containing protein [Rhizosphaericola mali]|uniref:SnoaL-like domain-containing protein n=1 Tax=Rhizosphaericola mali TaxID=2545455 RepID=A0A5P2G4P3_9BACT|nr:SnoaL-like domain-containing protein [Rhizosphaericola mali]QES88792.1 hypothetical protein E0W69_009050 [Rhizosphaericola mali]
MTIQEIATGLVDLLRSGYFEKAQKTFLAEDVVSIEPNGSIFPQETEGLSNILQNGANFRANIDKVNHLEISDPLVTDNTIAILFSFEADTSDKGRISFKEVCVFLVKGEKIFQEIYYY